MTNNADPSVHAAREQQLVRHVLNLLDDSRLRLDTRDGHRAVTSMKYDQPQQPSGRAGEALHITFWQRRMLLLKQPIAHLRLICCSPTPESADEPIKPMTTPDINRALGDILTNLSAEAPTTIVLCSTCGFALEAHEAADRRPDRTLILVEPNDAGGWNVYGSPEAKSLVDLFDPETEEAKRSRFAALIDQFGSDLAAGAPGIPADRLASRAQLPLPWIERELKSYAKDHAGLAAKRVDGKLVLLRE